MFNCTFILLSAEWKSLLYEGSHPPVRVKDYADLIIFRRYRRGGHHNVFFMLFLMHWKCFWYRPMFRHNICL